MWVWVESGRGIESKVEATGLVGPEVSSFNFWKLCEDGCGAIKSVYSECKPWEREMSSSGGGGGGGGDRADIKNARVVGREGRQRVKPEGAEQSVGNKMVSR